MSVYTPRVQLSLFRPATLHKTGRRLAMCPCVEIEANDKQREDSSRQGCWPLHEVPWGTSRGYVRTESVGLPSDFKGSYDTAMVRLSLAGKLESLGARGESEGN